MELVPKHFSVQVLHSAACWPQPKRTENAHFGIATDGTNFFAGREEVWE
jgi:hypothetical protein